MMRIRINTPRIPPTIAAVGFLRLLIVPFDFGAVEVVVEKGIVEELDSDVVTTRLEVCFGDEIDGVARVVALEVITELDDGGVEVGVVNWASKCCMEASELHAR